MSLSPFIPPRLSVIIRTLGRPELLQAVDSVRAQSHRPIEIVLVNAAGSTLPRVHADDIAMLEVNHGRPLTRPEAANAGLAAASGDHLCFLDDDDYFQPDHLASLLALLSAHPHARLAYSGALLVHADGRPHARLNRPFDRDALYRANYIQMGAALFSRSLIEGPTGARFDESLLNFQDWDFWIQLVQRTDFIHSGKTTLCWRVFDGDSGSGMGRNANPALQQTYTRRIHQKWSSISTTFARALLAA